MFDYILSLGGTVFVPIIMIVIGLIFRIPWLQAIKAGVTVGIGFVGMGLVIVMAIDSLSPPIKVMIERFGLALHVFDVGAGPASGVGYATAIGAMIIPVIFLLNVTMLVTRLTKTMNVDIYNYWHYAITGTVVQLMTGSLIYGVLGAICHAALSLKMADWTAKRVQNIVGLEGISIPQGYGSSSVPLFVLLDAIYEKIPFMKGRNIDAQEIQKRYGMVGDPVIIGVVLGLIFGLAAGEGFKGCASLMITVAAIMVLFPRMIRLIVEGLMPISDGARKFFQKYFKGREVYIGLDTAVTLGASNHHCCRSATDTHYVNSGQHFTGQQSVTPRRPAGSTVLYLYGYGYPPRRPGQDVDKRGHRDDYRPADRHPVRALLH